MKTKPRNTLNKAIAAAPTHAQKWQRAIEGNTPATAIDKLVSSAASYWKPAPRTAQWEAECKEAYVEARNAIGKPLTPAEMATPADKQFWSAKAWGEWDTQCQASLTHSVPLGIYQPTYPQGCDSQGVPRHRP